METAQQPALGGTWTHSFEEDAGDVQVYRRSDAFTFPPSRRPRETLDFQQAGQVVSGMPGADDRRQMAGASLTPLGMNRFRIGEGRVIEIIESGADILKLRET
jgi:hypothetical protein